jgi:hypothetical protein
MQCHARYSKGSVGAQRQEESCAISLPHCRLYSFNRLGPGGCGETFQEAVAVREMFNEYNITAYLLNKCDCN